MQSENNNPACPVFNTIKSTAVRSLRLCVLFLLALPGTLFNTQQAYAQDALDLEALGYSPDQINEMTVLSQGRLLVPCVTVYKDGVRKGQFRDGLFSAMTTRFPILLSLDSLTPSATSCLSQINSFDISSLTFSGTIQHQVPRDGEFVVIDLYDLVLSQNPLAPLNFMLSGPESLYRMTPSASGAISLSLLPGVPALFQPEQYTNSDEYSLTDTTGEVLNDAFNLLVLDAGIEITAEEELAPLFSGDSLLTGLFKLVNHSQRIVHPLSLSLLLDEEEEEPNQTPTPATPVNVSPSITSPGSFTVAENQAHVADIQSSDPNGETEGSGLSYSLTGGSDSALFSINAATGVLVFVAAPDFEAPADADIDNIYQVSVTVTDAGGLNHTSNLNITVSDANDPPSITSAATANAAENQTAVLDASATDLEGDTEGAGLIWSLGGGADQALFGIDANSGVLTFITGRDFEAPNDTGNDNVYEVNITVTDSGGQFATQAVAVTVTDANDPPAITSSATANAAENQTAVLDASATDLEGDTEGAGLTWSLSGGADQALFSIDANTGVLAFITARDFETPNDTGNDNVYDVNLTVTDSIGLTTTQAVAVTVTDANDPPAITSAAAVNAAENQTAVLDTSATDPDGDTEGAGLIWSLSGGADQGLFSIDGNSGVLAFLAAPDFEAPGDADTNNVYALEITVTDSTALSATQTLSVTVTNVNEAPLITSSATLSVDENLTAVIDVQSTDIDGETEGAGLAYSLSGGADQGLFSIDANTGALAFVAAPNFEAPGDAGANNVHEVAVTVTDAGGLVNAQTLTLTVQNVNEPPVLTTSAGGYSVFEDAIRLVYFDAEDPEGDDFTFAMAGSENGTLYYPNNLTNVDRRISSTVFDLSGTTDPINELLTPINVSELTFEEFIGTSAKFSQGFVFGWKGEQDIVGSAEFRLVLRDELGAESAESTFTMNTLAVNDTPLIKQGSEVLAGDTVTSLVLLDEYYIDTYARNDADLIFETNSTENLNLSFIDVEIEAASAFTVLFTLTVSSTLPAAECPVTYRNKENNIVTLAADPLTSELDTYSVLQQYLSTLAVNCSTTASGAVTAVVSDGGLLGDCYAPHPDVANGEIALDGKRCVRASTVSLNLTFVDP